LRPIPAGVDSERAAPETEKNRLVALHLDFSRTGGGAFGRRQTEIRWHIAHEISGGDGYGARREFEAEDLKEQFFEGRMAIPDNLLVFLNRKRDLGPDSLSLVAAPRAPARGLR
jgi:hypothetical protein